MVALRGKGGGISVEIETTFTALVPPLYINGGKGGGISVEIETLNRYARHAANH